MDWLCLRRALHAVSRCDDFVASSGEAEVSQMAASVHVASVSPLLRRLLPNTNTLYRFISIMFVTIGQISDVTETHKAYKAVYDLILVVL